MALAAHQGCALAGLQLRTACPPRRAAVPGAGVEVVQVDLADLGSIHSFAARAVDVGKPLDVMVNNAGVMACPQLETKQGHELQVC